MKPTFLKQPLLKETVVDKRTAKKVTWLLNDKACYGALLSLTNRGLRKWVSFSVKNMGAEHYKKYRKRFCVICNFQFSTREAFLGHYLKQHRLRGMPCSRCHIIHDTREDMVVCKSKLWRLCQSQKFWKNRWRCIYNRPIHFSAAVVFDPQKRSAFHYTITQDSRDNDVKIDPRFGFENTVKYMKTLTIEKPYGVPEFNERALRGGKKEYWNSFHSAKFCPWTMFNGCPKNTCIVKKLGFIAISGNLC